MPTEEEAGRSSIVLFVDVDSVCVCVCVQCFKISKA